MAEEKKTSTKADAKSEKTAKAAKSKDKKKSKKNPFKSIASFFKSVKAEGKKVVWAPAKDVLKNTIIVLVVVIIAALGIVPQNIRVTAKKMQEFMTNDTERKRKGNKCDI